MIQTFIVYNLMLFSSTGFAYLYSKTNNKLSSQVYLTISFLSIAIPAVIRYDIGPDYSVYVNLFKNISDNLIDSSAKEYSFYLISKIFSFLERGYFIVIGFFFIASLFLLYYISEKKYLHYVLFFFMTLPIGYFTFDDQIRQVVSIMIFIYSIRHIEERNLKKYIILIIFAMLFHLSALVLFPVYYLARVSFSVRTSIVIIILFLTVYITGYSHNFIELIYESTPFYNEYADEEEFLGVAKLNTGFGVLLYTIVYSISVVYKKRMNRPILSNILLMGIVLYLFSSGNLNIERVSKYFLTVSLFTLAMLFAGGKKINFFIVKVGVLFFVLLLFEKTIILDKGNNYPYKTIFSDEAEVEYLEPSNW